MNIKELLDSAEKLAIRPHFYVEGDGHYSCPLSPNGYLSVNSDTIKCDCGVDGHNNKVKEIFHQIRQVLLEKYAD